MNIKATQRTLASYRERLSVVALSLQTFRREEGGKSTLIFTILHLLTAILQRSKTGFKVLSYRNMKCVHIRWW